MDVMAKQPVMELGDYVSIFKRRKLHMLIPFVLVLGASLVLAFALPSVYRSEATVLIEQQEIPQEFVETTVTGYVQQRLEEIKQRLLTRQNLWDIAEKMDLYPEKRQTQDRQEFVREMRESIAIEMVDVKASSPGNGRQVSATIAFTLAFEANAPVIAQKVARELTTLYLEENRRSRSEKAEEVSKFLDGEAQRLLVLITEHEQKLADFKKENVGQLPELQSLNLRLMEQTEGKIERTENNIRALQDRIAAMSGQLAITNPNKDIIAAGGQRLQSANERLSVLTAQYLSLQAKYAADHPDVVKLRREIQSLEGQAGGVGSASRVATQLSLEREKLSLARQKYAEEHPDVKKLKRSVGSLEQALRASPNLPAAPRLSTGPADNPLYVSLRTQVGTAAANLRAEQERLIHLNEKLIEYESRLVQTPEVERGYLDLSRDYDNSRKKYAEIKEKQLQAQLAEQLEKDQKGERFTLTQPAGLPTLPDSPNRLGIALLGFVLAFGTGLGSAGIAEYFDRTIRGARSVAMIFHAPPLATIPYIQNERDVATERRRKWLLISFISVIVIVVAFGLANYFL